MGPQRGCYEQSLVKFQKKWDDAYPTIADSWKRNWQGIIPFLDYPDYIRKAIYTTNTVEAAKGSVRQDSLGALLYHCGVFSPENLDCLPLISVGITGLEDGSMHPRVFPDKLPSPDFILGCINSPIIF